MKKYKIFVVAFICVFMFVGVMSPVQEVEANPLLAALTPEMIPYIAAALVAGGLVFANQDAVIAAVQDFWTHATDQVRAVIKWSLAVGAGYTAINAAAHDAINQYISDLPGRGAIEYQKPANTAFISSITGVDTMVGEWGKTSYIQEGLSAYTIEAYVNESSWGGGSAAQGKVEFYMKILDKSGSQPVNIAWDSGTYTITMPKVKIGGVWVQLYSPGYSLPTNAANPNGLDMEFMVEMLAGNTLALSICGTTYIFRDQIVGLTSTNGNATNPDHIRAFQKILDKCSIYAAAAATTISVPLTNNIDITGNRVIDTEYTGDKKVAFPVGWTTAADWTEKTAADVTATDTVIPYIPVETIETPGADTGTLTGILDALSDFFDFDKPINLEPLRVSGSAFTTKFPFSLPWDLKKSFESIAGQNDFNPIIHIAVPAEKLLGGKMAFDIDLSMFAGLIQVAKVLELIIFDIGLILITRKILGGDV